MTLSLATAAANLDTHRWRAAVRLLACVTPIGRWGLALARRAGVEEWHMADAGEDVGAIWAAIVLADERGVVDVVGRHRLIVARLRLAGFWDPIDHRLWVEGSRWGPGPTAALFTAVSRWDAEAAVPRVAADLLAADASWGELADRAGRGVA